MNLTLQIENFHQLDDGGAVSVDVPESGISVGRGAAMGWVLPDVSRHISSHHFDIGFDGRGWWLRDLSTNGTFLHGQRYRLDGPHRLSHGDRFQVGQYVIVALIGQGAQPAPQGPMSPASLPDFGAAPSMPEDDPWAVAGTGHPVAIDPMPQAPARRGPDFAEEFIATPAHFAPPSPQPAPPPSPPPPAPPPAAAQPAYTAPPPPATPQPPAAPPQAAAPVTADIFLRAFCSGAGLPADLFAEVPADALARSLGEAMRLVSGEVMLSLQDRAAAKQFALAGERTMRGATDNNPLKFLPDAEQAIEAMFLRPRAGFQTGPAGLEDALKDLRLHQAAVFAALQPALARLLGDLAPEKIEAEAEAGGVRLGSNRKARAWEIFVQRWDAKSAGHDNGILDEFLALFAASYRDMVMRAQGGAMPIEPGPRPVLTPVPNPAPDAGPRAGLGSGGGTGSGGADTGWPGGGGKGA